MFPDLLKAVMPKSDGLMWLHLPNVIEALISMANFFVRTFCIVVIITGIAPVLFHDGHLWTVLYGRIGLPLDCVPQQQLAAVQLIRAGVLVLVDGNMRRSARTNSKHRTSSYHGRPSSSTSWIGHCKTNK